MNFGRARGRNHARRSGNRARKQHDRARNGCISQSEVSHSEAPSGPSGPSGGAPSGPSGPIAAHCTLGLLKKYEKIIHGISHYTIISYFRSFGKSAACDLSLSSRRALQAVFLGSLCCRLGRACRESPCAPIGVSRSHTTAQKSK